MNNKLTENNIKINMVIKNEFGTWKVLNKSDDGIWEIRGESGEKCLFSSEMKYYNIVK